MLSNGATHLARNTFLAVTNEDTDNVFLVTSSISENQASPLSINRRIRFHADSSLAFSAPDDDIEDASSRGGTPSSVERHHSAHASPTGRQVAFIAGVGTRHIVFDVLSARVCEFCSEDRVVSAAWLPGTMHITVNTQAHQDALLLLLLANGMLAVIDTSSVKHGVVFAVQVDIDLAAVVDEFLRVAVYQSESRAEKEKLNDRTGRKEAQAWTSGKDGAPQPDSGRGADATTLALEGGAPLALLDKKDGKKSRGKSSSSKDGALVVADPKGASRELASEKPPHSNSLPATGFMGDVSKVDFVSMCVIPATPGLPSFLLVVNRFGDVFAVKLSDTGRPKAIMETATGHLTMSAEEERRLRTIAQEQRFSSRPGVHALVEVNRKEATSSETTREEALGINVVMLNERLGLRMVLVLYSSGRVRGYYITDVDLLARNTRQEREDVLIAVGQALNTHANGEMAVPSWVRSATQLVQMDVTGNACLVRYSGSAYLIVVPVWCDATHAWLYRHAGGPYAPSHLTRPHDGMERVPRAGCDPNVFPSPVATRLPYDVDYASTAIGVDEVLIFPQAPRLQVSTKKQQHVDPAPCPRSRVIIASITNCVLSALYADAGGMILRSSATAATPSAGSSVDPAAAAKSKNDSSIVNANNNNNNMSSNKNNSSSSSPASGPNQSIERLLGMVCECHRLLLCGYPPESIDKETASLAATVEMALSGFTKRQFVLNERQKRLKARMSALNERCQGVSSSVDRMHHTLLEANTHRQGQDALLNANHQLGQIHSLLNDLERQVDESRKVIFKAAAKEPIE